MRPTLFALTTAAALALPAAAQEPKEEKKAPSMGTPPPVTEVAGRSFEQWVKEIGARDPSKRELAMRNVLLFGPEKAYQAVPALLFELKKHTAYNPIDLSVRNSGIAALSTILGSAKDPDPKHLREAVAILRTFMKDSQTVVRHRAVQALPQFGPDSRAAFDEVIKLVSDPDTWETRQAAVQTLTVLAADPKSGPAPRVVAAFMKALADPSHQVRFAALAGLAAVAGPADPEQKAGMVRKLDTIAHKDVDPSVQLWSRMAIMTVQQKITDEHLGAVAKMLRHDDVNVRQQAAQALAMAGPAGKSAVAPLIAALADPDPGVVGGSIMALARIEAPSAIGPLRRLADDSEQSDLIRKAAADAVEHLRGGKKKAEKAATK